MSHNQCSSCMGACTHACNQWNNKEENRKVSHCRRLLPAHPGAHRKLVLAYRTENANRIKRKEKRKMDVINILINPSEKAKCGHGAMLTTVPPGAAAGGGLGQAAGPGLQARPGPAASPRCNWRNRTSSSTRSSCIVFWSVTVCFANSMESSMESQG